MGPAHTPCSYKVDRMEDGCNRSHLREVPVPPTSSDMSMTRSGRLLRAPERLDLWTLNTHLHTMEDRKERHVNMLIINHFSFEK